MNFRTGLELQVVRSGKNLAGGIHVEISPSVTNGSEGYVLEIASGNIFIRAVSDAGLFYGVQSLLQIAGAKSTQPGATLMLPAMRISDQPRFAWRGFMLDESRHFFGKKTVEDLLDTMASLKLNRFHWHLTDEPGWRIQITNYPRLAEIGGFGNWSDTNAPAAFYTQSDIREIVEYARLRHIVIVPEIDMPGHATAATRAYPAISGGGEGQWAGFTFNPAKEETYVFLENVLGEIAALFPGQYIHLGGDEVHYGNQSWSTDPEMIKFTHDHGMSNAVDLERYFVTRTAGIINKLGKTAIGWDEIADSGVAPSNTAVMWWRHDKPAVLTRLLENNFPVVLCPRIPCYFDFVQDDSHQVGRRWEKAFNTLEKVYNFPDTATDGLIPAGKRDRILGVEACAWTERIQNRERLGFMVFPRLAALAEAAWTPAQAKNQSEFLSRLPIFLRELDRRKIPYFNPFDPTRTPEPAGPVKKSGGTSAG